MQLYLLRTVVVLIIIWINSESSSITASSSSSTTPSVVTSTIAATTADMTTSTSTTTDNHTTTTPNITAAVAMKTIFLIRHAESDENRRLRSLKTAFKDLTRFALPKTKDIMASCELIRIDLQINSNVSSFGKQQISHMAQTLNENNFITKQNIQLLVHSPLIRAKETCRDMFHCILSDPSDESSPLLPPPTSSSEQQHNITEVIELDLLTEMTPSEWIPGNAGSLYNRMRAFETWLLQRPETTIVCVGHSQYFKALLQLPYKFQNCDVIRLQFDPSPSPSDDATTTSNTSCRWSNIQNEHLCRITNQSLSDDTCVDTNHTSTTSTNVDQE